MPKKKTHKGLKKRVKITASGKVKGHKAFLGHLMSTKSAKRKHRIKRPMIVTEVYAKVMREMLDRE